MTMSVETAEMILSAAGVYFAAGVVFALAFLVFGLRQVDALAANGSPSFKALILPGVVGLWPLVFVLWLKALTTGERK